jgi:hypothetical protein
MVRSMLNANQLLTNSAAHFGERSRAPDWRSSPINCHRAPSNHGPGSTPPLSAHLLRRLAALKSVSRAHVTGLASSDSAADSICFFSASVIGISIMAVLRSLGFLGGLPRLVSIQINISIKNSASTLVMQISYLYNKYSQRKTPGSVGTRPRATRTGFRQIPAS